MTEVRLVPVITVLVVATFVSAQVASAQKLWAGAGGGFAVPLGDQSDLRTRDLSLTVGIGNVASSGWGLRADAEYFRLGATDLQRAMRGFGLSVGAALFFGNQTIRPYMLASLGAYRLQIEGVANNPYGTTLAGSVGVGLDLHVYRSVGLFAETRYVVHATDYGLGGLGLTSHGPIHFGVRWLGGSGP